MTAETRDSPGNWLYRFLSYHFAPFMPSQWRKLVSGLKRDRRSSAKFCAKLCLYYVLFSPFVAMPLYNFLLFFPMTEGFYDTKEVAGVAKKDCYFQSPSGKKLHAWYFEKEGSSRTFLISHGNAGNLTHRTALIALLLGTGASVFIYDYEGYGKSEGAPSVNGACGSGEAAFKYLTETLHLAPQTIVLYGESLGTGITCQIAKKNQPAAVVLQSAFSSLPSVAAERIFLFHLYPSWTYPVNTLDNLAYVRSKTVPLLIIHGMQDRVISEKNAEALLAAATSPKGIVRLSDTGHNDCCINTNYQMLTALNIIGRGNVTAAR
ncbi:MAG: alpha/beta hydrolase [Candidatus Obscuribacterales bacterium]|nr:alpha/beta hydrolase [Candidatus Obscuribacterales bacterium]